MNSKDLNSHDERSRSSSPLNIPPPSSLSSSAHHNGLPHRHHPIANSAPTTRRHIPLSPSLVDPVMEESDVVVSSRVRSYAIESTKRRRESELGDLSSPPSRRYGTLSLDGGFGRLDGHGGFDGESIQVPRELEQSVEVAEDYVKIASRNKRAEHATTYVCIQNSLCCVVGSLSALVCASFNTITRWLASRHINLPAILLLT